MYKRVKLSDVPYVKGKIILLSLLATIPTLYDWAEGRISTGSMIYRTSTVWIPTILSLL